MIDEDNTTYHVAGRRLTVTRFHLLNSVASYTVPLVKTPLQLPFDGKQGL